MNLCSEPGGKFRFGSQKWGRFRTERSDGGNLIGHGGSQQNSKTALLLDPATKKGIALMTGCEWVDPMKLAAKLMEEIK